MFEYDCPELRIQAERRRRFLCIIQGFIQVFKKISLPVLLRRSTATYRLLRTLQTATILLFAFLEGAFNVKNSFFTSSSNLTFDLILQLTPHQGRM